MWSGIWRRECVSQQQPCLMLSDDAKVDQWTAGSCVQFLARIGSLLERLMTMASGMSVINTVRQMVSGNKRRYQKNGFNLDLSYIRSDIIAMGFPGENVEKLYRNDLDDVVNFLNKEHPDHHQIYNLCCEKEFAVSKFNCRVRVFPFLDHNPPPFELIRKFCEDADEYMNRDPKNVVAIHCKAGKGRTGVMVCCLLMHKKLCKTAEEALDHYGDQRTYDGRGVTIPSQIRYVKYYGKVINDRLSYLPKCLILRSIHMKIVTRDCDISFVVEKQGEDPLRNLPVVKSHDKCVECRKEADYICFGFRDSVEVSGDIKVEVYRKPRMLKKGKLFWFWFNTFFTEKRQVLLAEANTHTYEFKSRLSAITGNRMSCRDHEHSSRAFSIEDFRRAYVLELKFDELDGCTKLQVDKHEGLTVTVVFDDPTEAPNSRQNIQQYIQSSSNCCNCGFIR